MKNLHYGLGPINQIYIDTTITKYSIQMVVISGSVSFF